MLVERWRTIPGTATCEAVSDVTYWTTMEQLLADIYDVLAGANWQRGGRSSAPRPKRYPRPWEQTKARRLGSDPIPVSQFDDWWERAGKQHERDSARRRMRQKGGVKHV